MFDTLYLDVDSWDLTLDADANIAMASAPYAAAQDVASACRLWSGEYIYNTTRGIPYQDAILGQMVPVNVLTSLYNKEAQTVPDIATASTLLQYNRQSRALSGQIQLTLVDGSNLNVNVI
jgi:hypothetical protein